MITQPIGGRLHDLTANAVGHRSIAPKFKLRPRNVRRVFLLSLRLITFGDRSAHLAYLACLRGLIGTALDHRSLPPEFESRRGHI